MLATATTLYAGSQFWKIHTKIFDSMSSGYDPLTSVAEQKPGFSEKTALVVEEQPSGQVNVISVQPQPREWSTKICQCCASPLICECPTRFV